MEYTVKKLAALSGVSARTLRYYDQIGLVVPMRINSSGYRIYGQEQVDVLQEVLFYRELGLSLDDIGRIVHTPGFDRLSALREHLAVLSIHRARLGLLIRNVKKTIQKEEGFCTMTDSEKFEGFKKHLIQENEQKYGDEIRTKYGAAAIEKSNAKAMSLTQTQYEEMQKTEQELFRALQKAVREGVNPAEETGRNIAMLHRQWLSFTWPSYTTKAHRDLCDMYLTDERFRSYYEKVQPGAVEFLAAAVAAMPD